MVLHYDTGDLERFQYSIDARCERDPTFFPRNVRGLTFPLGDQPISPAWSEAMESIISSCTGLESLSIPQDAWITQDIMSSHDDSFENLTHLSLTCRTLSVGTTLSFYVPPSVTHLDMSYYLCTDWVRLFEDTPNLTHLILNNFDDGEQASRVRLDMARKVNYLLAISRPGFQAIVYVPQGCPPPEGPSNARRRWLDWVEGVSSQITDPRFVFVSLYGLYQGVKGVECYESNHDTAYDWGYREEGSSSETVWEFADQVLKRRKEEGAYSASRPSFSEGYLGL